MTYQNADDLYRHLISAKEWAERKHINAWQMFRDFNATWMDERARIGKGTLVFPGCTIMGHTHIGQNCVIGPTACLEEVKLGANSHVGFTAQLKRVEAGKRFIAKHHCCLIDAAIGSDVNIGAGVITANFDGVEKHVTRIGDGAFIGVNVNLIAPVTIGREAMVAAGSTINIDVPAYSLVIGRAPMYQSEGTYRRTTAKGYETIKIGKERLQILKSILKPDRIYPWLTRQIPALDNRMPIDLILEGKGDRVDAILTRLTSGEYTS